MAGRKSIDRYHSIRRQLLRFAPLVTLVAILLFAKMDLAIGLEVPGWLNANLRLVLEVFGSTRPEPPSR